MKVSKSELIKELEAEVKGESVNVVVNAFLKKIVDHLKADDEILFTGFGKFYVKDVAARKVTDPTGTVRNIPAHKSAKVHMSKDVLNG